MHYYNSIRAAAQLQIKKESWVYRYDRQVTEKLYYLHYVRVYRQKATGIRNKIVDGNFQFYL